MTATEQWFIAERGQHLTRLLLGTDGRLRVEAQPPDIGIDYLVFITEPSRVGRCFGVEVKTARPISRLVNQHGRVRSNAAKRALRRVQDIPFPVALLILDVDAEVGYIGWLLEPEVAGGRPELKPLEAIEVAEFTPGLREQVLRRVNAWYDARRSLLRERAGLEPKLPPASQE